MDVEQALHEREGRGRAAGPHPLAQALFPELCTTPAERGAELLIDAATFGVALLFARTHLFFGMYPFAIAFVASGRRRVIPAAIGALLGALTLPQVGGVFAAATLLLLLLRVGTSLPVGRRVIFPVTGALFSEGIALRTLSASLTGAALAVYELLVSRGAAFAFYFASIAVLSTAVLTFLFAPIRDLPLTLGDLVGRRAAAPALGAPPTALSSLSLLSLLTAMAYALLPLSLFGLSLASLFTVGVTLLTARRFGAARAGVVGLFLGLVGKAVLSPAYALLGLAAGFLFPFGTVYGTLGGLVTAGAFAGYALGLSGFLAVLPEGIIGGLLLLPTLSRLDEARDPAQDELSRRRLEEAALAAAGDRRGEGVRLTRLGAAFSALSGMFYRLSDEERRPLPAEYFVECQRVCARYCATCSHRVRCWEQGDRAAEGAVFGLALRLHEAGRISAEDLPDELRSVCRRMDDILEEIREECAAMSLRRRRGDYNEFLSFDYDMLAKLLSEAAEADRREEEPCREEADRLVAALGEAAKGLAVSVCGTRERRVAVAAVGQGVTDEVAARLHAAGEELLGCALSPPLRGSVDGVATLTMHAERRFCVHTASASVPLSGSGDRLRFFEAPEDMFYAVLSDGMGSGEEAAAVASVSVDFLETMLTAGTGRAAALRMLNNLVRIRREECSATVDMLVFDLLSGHAAFLKSGAAPSYIKRGGEVFRVRSRTMPLGLVRTPDTERIRVEVGTGDILVLLSDGMVPDHEEPAWLFPLLSEEPGDDLDALATRIVAEAVSRIPEPRDDITVGLVRIEECGE